MLHISSCQYSSLNNTLTNDCPKRTSFLRFGKKVFVVVVVWITVILVMICMLLYFFICWLVLPKFTNHYMWWVKPNKPQLTPRPLHLPFYLFFLSFFLLFFLECCNTSWNVLSTETKIFGAQNHCNPHAFHLWSVRKLGVSCYSVCDVINILVTSKWSMKKECTKICNG